MTTATYSDRRDSVLAAYRRRFGRGRARVAKAFGDRLEVASSGSVVTTDDGERFLDCAGLGVFLLGHRHPRVVQAVAQQLDEHPLSTRTLLDPVLADAADALARVAPEGLDYVHFACSGAEAVETALKLGRLAGAQRLVGAGGAFHGKTLGALSLMGQPYYRDPFEPLLPCTHVPFGDAAALEAELAAGPRACVVLEPIQGEAGVNLPPPGYLRAAELACREHGAMLVLDEIQTGLGRVGAWWAADREGVVPDVLLAGKSLSGGVVPVAAAVASPEAFEPLCRDPLIHSSTFGGAPLAAAAARAAIGVIEDEGLVERSARLGAELLEGLRTAAEAEMPHVVADVRGAGLLIGVELRSEVAAAELVLELVSERILTNHSFNAGRVVRLTPPAVMTDAEAEWLLRGFAAAAAAIGRRY